MRYRRWSRIITNDFLNDRRKRKSLGRFGGMLPWEIFRILTPYTPFSLVSESFRQDIGYANIVIESDLCANVRIFALMNVSSHCWSPFHENDCVFSRSEHQKVY